MIPEEYKSLPRLAGYAKVEIIVDSNEGFNEDNGKKHKTETFILEVDGYHSPLTAGNFIDLVNQKYYDGIRTDNVQELIVQFGKETKKPPIRSIPLEIFYRSIQNQHMGLLLMMIIEQQKHKHCHFKLLGQ